MRPITPCFFSFLFRYSRSYICSERWMLFRFLIVQLRSRVYREAFFYYYTAAVFPFLWRSIRLMYYFFEQGLYIKIAERFKFIVYFSIVTMLQYFNFLFLVPFNNSFNIIFVCSWHQFARINICKVLLLKPLFFYGLLTYICIKCYSYLSQSYYKRNCLISVGCFIKIFYS